MARRATERIGGKLVAPAGFGALGRIAGGPAPGILPGTTAFGVTDLLLFLHRK